MIIGINESKTLTRHISWKCKCKCDGKKYNSNQNWNNNKFVTDVSDVSVKNIIYVKKIIHVVAKMVNIYHVTWMIQCLPMMKL